MKIRLNNILINQQLNSTIMPISVKICSGDRRIRKLLPLNPEDIVGFFELSKCTVPVFQVFVMSRLYNTANACGACGAAARVRATALHPKVLLLLS